MRGNHYTKQTMAHADRLRLRGKNYREIKHLLGIPKSTLSTWFSKKHAHIFNKQAQLIHLAKIRLIARQSVRDRIENRDNNINREATQLLRKLKHNDPINKLSLGLLYWAEGSKHSKVSGLIFANTDPLLMTLFIALLRKSYPLDETKFRVRIHLHHYHEKEPLLKFWSELLNIPKHQFAKPFLKPRSKKKRFRKNSKGICLLRYADSNIRREILAIARTFAENILARVTSSLPSFNG